MIVIVDYDTGNLRSVENALKRLGARYRLSSKAAEIEAADRVLLPGVGEASGAMHKLRERGLVESIRGLRQPVLGICLGMQIMCRHSEEGGGTECLGIFDNAVKKFDIPGMNVPHMGWNGITSLKTPLFEGIGEGEYVYYVHSYAADINSDTAAVTDYGGEFSGAIARGNFYGVQFHPEKSFRTGERILKNFLNL